MKYFIFAAALILFCPYNSSAQSYSKHSYQSHTFYSYPGYYNGFGFHPGLSVYRDGSYSYNYMMSRRRYSPGYTPYVYNNSWNVVPFYGYSNSPHGWWDNYGR